jgi:hypothetical protein
VLSPLEPVPGAAQLKPNVRKTLDTSAGRRPAQTKCAKNSGHFPSILDAAWSAWNFLCFWLVASPVDGIAQYRAEGPFRFRSGRSKLN